jgi:hypothetical protein
VLADVVLLIGLVYAPLAPLTSFFVAMYAGGACLSARLDIAVIARSHFDSGGLLASIAARQAMNAVTVGALIHVAVLALGGTTGEWYHIILLAPIPLPILYARSRILGRQKVGLHGHCQGRLPLTDAAHIDASRPKAVVLHELTRFATQLHAWEPECAKDDDAILLGEPFAKASYKSGPAPGALADGEERQVRLVQWLRRYETADAVAFESSKSDV